MQLETTFLGEELPHPLMNGGGTGRTLEDVQRFARAEVSVVNVSIVHDQRDGNSGETYHRDPHFSVNALGLPSRGKYYYREMLTEMVRIVHAAGKKLMANISAFTPEQYLELAKICAEAGVDYIEFNFGCPNIKDGGVKKPIFSFYPDSMEQTLVLVGNEGIETASGIKFSPMSNPLERDSTCIFLLRMAEQPRVLRVSFVTLCNTFPDTLVLDPSGKPIIGVVLAGLGGPPMKPIALGHIHQFRENQKAGNLPDYVEYVGSGGVQTGQDVLDYRHEGASLVQATTTFIDHKNDPGVYGEIAAEYAELVEGG